MKYLVRTMPYSKRHYHKIRIFSSCCWINRDEKGCTRCDCKLYVDSKHFLQVILFETLVNATEGNTTHFRIDKIWTITHNNFQTSMFIGILFAHSGIIATHIHVLNRMPCKYHTLHTSDSKG